MTDEHKTGSTDDLKAIIAKLEASPEESWRVDDAIYEWFLVNDRAPAFARFTQSVDAALTLVPEGWFHRVEGPYDSMVYGAGLAPDSFLDTAYESPIGVDAYAPTEPLALTIAALRAHLALASNEGGE